MAKSYARSRCSAESACLCNDYYYYYSYYCVRILVLNGDTLYQHCSCCCCYCHFVGIARNMCNFITRTIALLPCTSEILCHVAHWHLRWHTYKHMWIRLDIFILPQQNDRNWMLVSASLYTFVSLSQSAVCDDIWYLYYYYR